MGFSGQTIHTLWHISIVKKANLINIFKKDASKIWSELNEEEISDGDNKLRKDLFDHFVEIGKNPEKEYFDKKHLKEIENFLKEYSNDLPESVNKDVNEILNKNFSR